MAVLARALPVGMLSLTRREGFDETKAQIHLISVDIPALLYMLQGKEPQCCPSNGQQHPQDPILASIVFFKGKF